MENSGLRIHFLQAGLERVCPIGDVQAEGLLDVCFVEHAVGRTFDLRGKFVAMAGLYVACRVSGIFGDHAGEVVPGAYALVAIVVDAGVSLVFAVLHDVIDGFCQVEGVGRRAALVKDDVERGFLSCEPQHGFDEIVSELAI